MNRYLNYIIIFFLAGCSASHQSLPGKLNNRGQTQGGVDVGNMQSAASIIPETNATITYPVSWKKESNAQELQLDNGAGSSVVASKAQLSEVTSPTVLSLQKFLSAKYTDRIYKSISINGLVGVRADLISTTANLRSDIYLLSETSDFIHLETNLVSAGDGIKIGEEILNTVRVEYKGQAIADSSAKTVKLYSYRLQGDIRMKAAYTFPYDCYSYVECKGGSDGPSVLFDNSNTLNALTVGNAGYDHGRIIDLGSDDAVDFKSIRVDGKYLVAPSGPVPIADIYTEFTTKDLNQEKEETGLQKGHSYLVRLISWPDVDMITKIHVDELETGNSVQLTYQNLVSVPKADLQKQVDAINEYTKKYEMPRDEGEVTLYNRSYFQNYFYAAFNFKFATSGNMFVTNNDWDLMYEGQGEYASLSVPVSVSELGQVIDLGEIPLNSVSMAQFPDPNSPFNQHGTKLLAGHTYAIYHFDYNGEATYGAFKILEIEPSCKWIRLKWRRLQITTTPHFQKWIELKKPEGLQKMALPRTTSNLGEHDTQRFYPFLNKRGDQGLVHSETFEWNGDYLSVESRPWEKESGILFIGKNTDLSRVTLEQVERLRGQFSAYANHYSVGDVFALRLENYNDKTVMVLRIDAADKEKVEISYRYLYRGKTALSDDGD